MVLGELACGNLPQRARTLALLSRLPSVPQASGDLVHEVIELRGLGGRGIGWIDAHLLCAALISRSSLWTLDRRLADVAARTLG
jgi:hypothetical protein